MEVNQVVSQTFNSSIPQLWKNVQHWSTLNSDTKLHTAQELAFKGLVAPLSAISFLSSIYNFVFSNFLNGESDLIDKISEWSSRLAYFINGIYGGVNNAHHKNLPGGVGYSLVSLSAFFPKSLMYFVKGWGSLLDQLPSMAEDVAFNPEVKKLYNLQEGKEKEFNRYKNLWDSTEKTFRSCFIVLKDIVKDLVNGGSSIITGRPIYDTFVKSERRAERNLVASSLEMLVGVVLGTFFGSEKIGPSLRDIGGFHADIGLIAKGFSKTNKNKATGAGNLMYMFCGIFYTVGSVLDLIFRWTNIPKLELTAVGFDNLGFMLMTRANARDNALNNGQEKEANLQGVKPNIASDVEPPLQLQPAFGT